MFENFWSLDLFNFNYTPPKSWFIHFHTHTILWFSVYLLFFTNISFQILKETMLCFLHVNINSIIILEIGTCLTSSSCCVASLLLIRWFYTSQGGTRIWSFVFFHSSNLITFPSLYYTMKSLSAFHSKSPAKSKVRIFQLRRIKDDKCLPFKFIRKCRNFSRIDRNWKFRECSSRMFLIFHGKNNGFYNQKTTNSENRYFHDLSLERVNFLIFYLFYMLWAK